MMGLWQVLLAGVAALGLHVAGFAFVPLAGGSQAAGDGGASVITLAASDAGVAAIVAAWDAPPSVADAPVAPVAPDVAPALALPTADAAPSMPSLTALTQPITAETAPFVGDAPAPLPTQRPKARPARQAASEPSPVTKPKPAGSGTAAQVAAGSGSGTQAGSGGQASAGTLSGSAALDLKAEWGAGIRARIERKKRYPAGTVATGVVKLRLTVGVDGRVRALSILQPSGDAALDAAAVRAVQAAGRFAKAPKGVAGAESFTFNMRFER